jgi:16S rRNA processing protein RimM
MTKKTIVAGKILKPHGIKGLLKIKSFMQNPKDIFNYPTLFNKDLTKEYKIDLKHSKNPDTFIISVNNINTPEEAEELRNIELYLERDKLPKTDEDEYYYSDLEGLNILTNGEKKGIVLKVSDFGAGAMLEIEWEDGEEETIPFTDDFIKEVNLKENFVKIILPEYIAEK